MLLECGRRYDEAEERARRLINAFPEDEAGYFELALVAYEGRGSSAETDDFSRHVFAPERRSRVDNLRKILARLRRDTPAAIRLDHEQGGLTTGTGVTVWARQMEPAITLVNAGDLTAARSRVTAALALMNEEKGKQPTNSWLFAWLGQAHALLGDKAEALACATLPRTPAGITRCDRRSSKRRDGGFRLRVDRRNSARGVYPPAGNPERHRLEVLLRTARIPERSESFWAGFAPGSSGSCRRRWSRGPPSDVGGPLFSWEWRQPPSASGSVSFFGIGPRMRTIRSHGLGTAKRYVKPSGGVPPDCGRSFRTKTGSTRSFPTSLTYLPPCQSGLSSATRASAAPW